MKLFLGRLPREARQSQIRDCFEEFGEVLEVFMIDSQAVSNVGCAFVRMGSLEQAQAAIKELHEQKVIIPELREMGPMQVAFAKGEALRMGLAETEETLPSFKEARQRVADHKERRKLFEAAVQKQEALAKRRPPKPCLPEASELVDFVKQGQRKGGQAFRTFWRSFCEQGGSALHDPAKHPREVLANFVATALQMAGHEAWMKDAARRLPAGFLAMVPPPMPGMRPGGPGMPPPLCPFGGPGLGPCGMLPPMMCPPGMPMPCMPPPLPPPPPPPVLAEDDRGPALRRRPAEKAEVLELEECEEESCGDAVAADHPEMPEEQRALAALIGMRRRQDYTDVDAVSEDSG